MISPLEIALLTSHCPKNESNQVASLVLDVVEGKLSEILSSTFSKELLKLEDPRSVLSRPLAECFEFNVQSCSSGEDQEIVRLAIGVTCLYAFLQVNWTGPNLAITPSLILGLSERDEDDLNQQSISELAFGGEPAYHLAKSATFLRISQLLFSLPYLHCHSIPWWKLRVDTIHQMVLDEPVTLPQSYFDSLDPLSDRLRQFESDPDLLGRFVLEKGLLRHLFGQDKIAAEEFVRAAKIMGLEYELTGALGKRTKFQQGDLSQLVLLAESRKRKVEAEGGKGEEGMVSIPPALALNDDTLLEQTEFTSTRQDSNSRLAHLDPSSQPALHPLDQCIFIGLCLNVKNTSPAHGLTSEQMSPYIARVISHPRNWSVHTMALLLRSRLEASRTRTVERSTLQLQALIDQMSTADSSLSERLLYIHSLPLPSKWDLERELALRFLSLGVVRSAMDIFERLEMWEEVVQCWTSLERPEKGIEIVKDLLEGRKEESDIVSSRGKTTKSHRRRILEDSTREAKLWCLLGDLEPEKAIEHYGHAWEISKHTSGRAMRSLGGYYFARGKYEDAIQCLKKAVAINPLLVRSWFILGCACVRTEDWEGAREAFVRCVAIDDEDGESWSNLASVYLRLGDSTKETTDQTSETTPFSNKLLAFRALKYGLRFSYNNWRMWSNYMIVSLDVGELAEACRALGRVVEETSEKAGEEAVDLEVLERLVNAVVSSPFLPAGGQQPPEESHALAKRLTFLFTQTLLPRLSSPRVFKAHAKLLTWEMKWEEALESYLNAYRCGVVDDEKIEVDIERWREAVDEVGEVVDAMRNLGGRIEGSRWMFQARSLVRAFMGRTKGSFGDEPEWEKLNEILQELKN